MDAQFETRIHITWFGGRFDATLISYHTETTRHLQKKHVTPKDNMLFSQNKRTVENEKPY
jgi:hypothetical protein